MTGHTDFECRLGVAIPLRDGVRLNAALYRPRGRQRPVPCVVTLTPYGLDHFHDRAVAFASRGTPFLIVDVRGRGGSGGEFKPYRQEGADGHDVVEWLAAQEYCNGRVAMWGGSYLGCAQWLTAKERPPHLATIVPTAAPYLGLEFPMRNNISYPYAMQWIMMTSGRASQWRLFADRAYWSATFRRWHESGRPFREFDSFMGNPSALFQEWIGHPEPDDYWDAHNPTSEQYGGIEIPVLTITGSYDDDQPGALEHYRKHIAATSSAEPRPLHYLIIGPWNHSGTGYPRAQFGGLSFGAASVLDMDELHAQWYQWTMSDGPKPPFLQDQVAYYVMGAERWRFAPSLEEVTAAHEKYFLTSVGGASDVFASGSLDRNGGSGQPDAYVFDPRDGGLELDAEERASGDSLVDESLTLALRGRQLVYHSAPFEADTEISGFFRLEAWISIDCPDTDLYVSVHEIGAEGRSIRLTTDAVRARYRQGLRTPMLIQDSEPLQYLFERFTFVSREIKRGHRLRLVIAPMGRLIETTFAQRNFNSGGTVSEESAASARKVTVRLFHDSAHPSALLVPIGRAE